MKQVKVQKAATVTASGTPNAAQLAKINALSKTPLKAEEVYFFRVRLCDDQPDRDFERFDTEALRPLAALFRGKTGIMDHDWSAKRQVARIFDTAVCTDGGVTYIRADCYLLRGEKNAELIREIEGGIKKEVSVGCAMGRRVCSVCGAEYGTCPHEKGGVYGGQTCFAVLCDPKDAYEFSFVAVPAQREAGVIKAAKGGGGMTLEQFVAKSGTPELRDDLNALVQEAKFGRSCRENLMAEAVALGLLLDFGAEEGTLQKAFSALNGEELSALKTAMAQKAAALFPPATQLPVAKGKPAAFEAAYMI